MTDPLLTAAADRHQRHVLATGVAAVLLVLAGHLAVIAAALPVWTAPVLPVVLGAGLSLHDRRCSFRPARLVPASSARG